MRLKLYLEMWLVIGRNKAFYSCSNYKMHCIICSLEETPILSTFSICCKKLFLDNTAEVK